jgi:hypothetical protein
VDGLRLFGALAAGFVALIAAVVIAGFLYEALGLWATVIWGLALCGGLALSLNRRARSAS